MASTDRSYTPCRLGAHTADSFWEISSTEVCTWERASAAWRSRRTMFPRRAPPLRVSFRTPNSWATRWLFGRAMYKMVAAPTSMAPRSTVSWELVPTCMEATP